MDPNLVKRFFAACQEARRATELLPPLPAGMVPRHIFVLDTVHDLSETDGDVKVGDVSSALGVTKPSVTKLVSELEALGDLEKIPDARDRRVVRLRLTEQGQRHYDYYVRDYYAWLAQHFEAIDPDDLAVAASTIERAAGIMRNHREEYDAS